MTVSTVQQLDVYGPDHCEILSLEQARDWCRRLTHQHYENFTVLSRFVPSDRRDDFAAVYAFCRWADDLGDEIGDWQRSLELLGWWRRELEQCYAGEPRHPVFMALAPTVRRHDLPQKLFDDLIRAFEQDQQIRRYQTWEQLIGYCRLSADPVGRLVLMMLGEPRTMERFERSDAICTALQLTNHWQDVRRDILERDRIYIPAQMIAIDRFEERLIGSARQGYAIDRTFLPAARKLMRELVNRTWPLFEKGQELIRVVEPMSRPIIWLFAAGGQHILRSIEQWNYETVLHRPRLGRTTKMFLLARAWWLRSSGNLNKGRNG